LQHYTTIQDITSKVYTHIAKSLLCRPDSENSIVVVQKNDLANLPNARYSFVPGELVIINS
jgi:hypothetical protein